MVKYITIDKDSDGQRLDGFLKNNSAMNYIAIQKSLRNGRIRVNKKRKSANYRVLEDDVISLPDFMDINIAPKKTAENFEAQRPPIYKPPDNFIINQSDDFMTINKPAGLASQGGSKLNYHLDALLENYCNDDGVKPRLVHRLDRQTSGIMLIARNRNAAKLALNGFQQKEVRKYYLAIITGKMPDIQGEIDAPLLRNAQQTIIDPKGDTAISRYKILSQNKQCALILLMPITGRTHQLRVHMIGMGVQILGDDKYRPAQPLKTPNVKINQLFLHAYRLQWQAQNIDEFAPLPEHFDRMFAELDLKLPASEKLQKMMAQLYQG